MIFGISMLCKFLSVYILLLNCQYSITDEKINEFQSYDYCKAPCGTHNNTMCNSDFPAGGGPECAEWASGLTPYEQKLIVDMHNSFRMSIALGEMPNIPIASNMMKVTWHPEAAYVAERWAQQCQIERKAVCRVLLDGRALGQNFDSCTAESRESAIKQMLQKWFDLREHFKADNIAKYDPDQDLSHSFTQMVWANTSRVGCGFISKEKELDKQYRIVCNYLPEGNVKGMSVYKKGTACTQCPPDTKCSRSYPGLCTDVPSDFDIPKSATLSVRPLPYSCIISMVLCAILNSTLSLSHKFQL